MQTALDGVWTVQTAPDSSGWYPDGSGRYPDGSGRFWTAISTTPQNTVSEPPNIIILKKYAEYGEQLNNWD